MDEHPFGEGRPQGWAHRASVPLRAVADATHVPTNSKFSKVAVANRY